MSPVRHWQIPSALFRSPATPRGRCHLRARVPQSGGWAASSAAGIHDRSVGQRLRAGCLLRGVDLIAPHDVHYRNSLCQQIVGNDAAVAAPPHGFSAHDGAAIVAGQRSQLLQSGSESVRCRVIGIVPEGGDLPECIERWRPQTAKSRQMSVGYPSSGERFRERVDVELRIRPRARDRPHVNEQIHGHLLEQSQKFGDRTRRMT